MKQLILGGARSGKSRYAERLATESDLPVTYIATAQPGDDEFADRIRQHQARRPAHWQLVEEPFFIADTLSRLAAPGQCLIVECLTVWLAQWLCPDCHPPRNSSWETERAALLEILPKLPGNIVLVSNEVGMGIVPMGELNRRFQDEQGWLNQEVARVCDSATMMIAGMPLVLKPA